MAPKENKTSLTIPLVPAPHDSTQWNRRRTKKFIDKRTNLRRVLTSALSRFEVASIIDSGSWRGKGLEMAARNTLLCGFRRK